MAGGATRRREARERALGLLYEAEVKDEPASEVLAAQPATPDDYACLLVDGVGSKQDELDALISSHSPKWPLERMPALDRAVLRIGVYELLHQPSVPTGVVLSEAVELASEYSTDDSARFVNGLLGQVASEVRPG